MKIKKIAPLLLLIMTMVPFSCSDDTVSEDFKLSYFEINRFVEYSIIMDNTVREVSLVCNNYLKNPTEFKANNPKVIVETKKISIADYSNLITLDYTKVPINDKKNNLKGIIEFRNNNMIFSKDGAKSEIKLFDFSIDSCRTKVLASSKIASYTYFINLTLLINKNGTLNKNINNGRLVINKIDTINYSSEKIYTKLKDSYYVSGTSEIVSEKFDHSCATKITKDLVLQDNFQFFIEGEKDMNISRFSEVKIDYGKSTLDSLMTMQYINVVGKFDMYTVLKYK